MTDTDDVILEYLDQCDIVLNKRGLEINLKREGHEISYSSIKRHLQMLEDAGLVKKEVEQGSWYRITQKGREFLEGDVDLRDN